jgi:hypothetical protein
VGAKKAADVEIRSLVQPKRCFVYPSQLKLEILTIVFVRRRLATMDHDLDPPLVTLMVGVGIPMSLITLPAWGTCWEYQGINDHGDE